MSRMYFSTLQSLWILHTEANAKYQYFAAQCSKDEKELEKNRTFFTQ